ncbi:MAG: LuxR family transcriptional regulator [Deltaproteobacteria bacterium]|nr:MAG: LuxR family transcriptional regulator [Deltaproteobacteria bacterium]
MTTPNGNTVAYRLLAVVAALVGADLLSDVGSGVDLAHVGLEGLAAALALAGAGWFYGHQRRELAEAKAMRAQAEQLLAGLGDRVDRQLTEWSLSEAETEVAVLLLKGLSFKEIGAVRDTSERTAREQARAVYKKSGLAGRAELAAWFLDDLL